MLVRLALLLSIFACSFPAARADDASKLAKAGELLRVMKTDQMMTQLMNQVEAQMNSGMMQRLTGAKFTPDQRQRLDAFQTQVDKVVEDAMSWNALEPQYAKLYAAAFTEPQLDDMLAFYKSPTGQAYLVKRPVLMKEGNEIGQQRMTVVIPKLQQMLKDFVAQEKARSTQAHPSQ